MANEGTAPQEKHGVLFGELAGMLSASVENHDDFVLAWEPQPGEDPEPGTEPVVHVMTGNLITPCRLNGLRAGHAVQDEGARIMTFKGKNVTARTEK